MKKIVNGVISEISPDEQLEMDHLAQEIPAPKKSDSERIAELEAALNALLERRVQ